MKRDTADVKVGIDIGYCAIKIVQISGTGEKPDLTAAGSKDIIGLPASEVADALKSLSNELRISAKDVNISVSGPAVIVRFISLPRMDEDSLKGAIRYEAEKFIPYNISDCTIDFQTLRSDEKENKLNVLLVAAKKDFVRERIALVEKCGFSVRLVDVDVFALANAFLRAHSAIDPEKSCAILNIGGTFTNLSILKGGQICFARDIAVGGNDFTAAIAKKFAVDQKSAEEFKLRPPKEKSASIADCVGGTFGDLSDEVKLSFGYYENQAGKGIDEVYISGGGANIAGFEQMFEEALGSKPAVWNPIESFNTVSSGVDQDTLDKMKGSLAIATGLAIRQSL